MLGWVGVLEGASGPAGRTESTSVHCVALEQRLPSAWNAGHRPMEGGVMSQPLSERPDLAQLGRQAKELTEAHTTAKAAGRTTVGLRIVGHRLPGLQWTCYESIHLGVQQRRAATPPTLVRGDADEAIFDLTVDLVTDDQGTDFRGPFVQGRRGQRFVYLSWGQVGPGGAFEMFRRAKLHLSALAEQDVAHAAATGATIEATLDLTDAHGGPLCATVRPPRVHWRLTPNHRTTT
jgi:Family of unknown function (DUF5990)